MLLLKNLKEKIIVFSNSSEFNPENIPEFIYDEKVEIKQIPTFISAEQKYK